MDCGARFPVEDGYLNLQVGPEEPVVPFQKLMQMKGPVAVYEGIWRPLGYFCVEVRETARARRLALGSALRIASGRIARCASRNAVTYPVR